MTQPQIAELFHAVKLRRGRCLEASQALQAFLDAHPDVDPREARNALLGLGRAPYPSVDGNPPVDRNRPWWDGRFWQRFDASGEAVLQSPHEGIA